MILDEDDYILGVWFCEYHNFGNILLTVLKNKGAQDTWHFHYRLWHFNQPEKRKKFYLPIQVFKSNEEDAIKKAEEQFNYITDEKIFLWGIKKFEIKLKDKLIVQGDRNKYLELAENKIWIQKVVK